MGRDQDSVFVDKAFGCTWLQALPHAELSAVVKTCVCYTCLLTTSTIGHGARPGQCVCGQSIWLHLTPSTSACRALCRCQNTPILLVPLNYFTHRPWAATRTVCLWTTSAPHEMPSRTSKTRKCPPWPLCPSQLARWGCYAASVPSNVGGEFTLANHITNIWSHSPPRTRVLLHAAEYSAVVCLCVCVCVCV